jgi:hypothetical protein
MAKKELKEPIFNLFGPDSTPVNNTSTDSTPADNASTVSTGSDYHRKGEMNNISQIPADERNNKNKSATEVRNMYDRSAQKQDLDTHSSDQNEIHNDWQDDPQKWFDAYKFWNWNLAKHNPSGNLNNRSFGRTLAMSRIADAVNNQKHYIGGTSGYRSVRGGNTYEGERGTNERWEPIGTEETRQMERDRQLDTLQRQRQINRAENVQDYSLELQKMADRARSELAKYQSQSNINLQRFMQNTAFTQEYAGSWQAYWSSYMTKFARELDLDIRDRVLAKIRSLGYVYAQVYSNLSGGGAVPSPVMQALWQNIQTVIDTANNPREASALAFGAMVPLVNMITSIGTGIFNGAVGGISSNFMNNLGGYGF